MTTQTFIAKHQRFNIDSGNATQRQLNLPPSSLMAQRRPQTQTPHFQFAQPPSSLTAEQCLFKPQAKHGPRPRQSPPSSSTATAPCHQAAWSHGRTTIAPSRPTTSRPNVRRAPAKQLDRSTKVYTLPDHPPSSLTANQHAEGVAQTCDPNTPHCNAITRRKNMSDTRVSTKTHLHQTQQRA